MSTATVVYLVGIQNGYAMNGLTPTEGGCSYVPGGEEVGEPAARLLRNMSKATILLDQAYYASAPIGLTGHRLSVTTSLNRRLLRGAEGRHRFGKPVSDGTIMPTIRPVHCVEGTKSSLFVDDIMDILPTALREKLLRPSSESALKGFDGRGNTYHVLRKATPPDLKSQSIAAEHDTLSKIAGTTVFDELNTKFQTSGVTAANIYIGGLATNYEVEHSHRNVCQHLVKKLKARGVRTNVFFLSDISRGIPLATPDGRWPDLNGALKRMQAFGTTEMTTDSAIRQSMAVRRHGTRQLTPDIGS